jgi:hypothetical protein
LRAVCPTSRQRANAVSRHGKPFGEPARTAAHIHLGKRGVAGNVLIALCGGNCHSGMRGTATFASDVVDKIERGQTYVNVHTGKNPAGEIRGQVKVTDG